MVKIEEIEIMINTAVILAAGMGARIPSITKDIPKGFIKIEGNTLIEMSVSKLLEAGIESIVIVTGYKDEYYKNLAEKYISAIKLIQNNDYKTTGSMHSLFLTRGIVKNDFLLLESDILYDKYGLGKLLDCQHNNVILASGMTKSGDEIYIEADDNSFFANMSKNASDLQNIHSEFTGLTKISTQAFDDMCMVYERNKDKWNLKLEYEQFAICEISRKNNFFVLKDDDFAWCEIDDLDHLDRAKKMIYPIIAEKELKGAVNG